MFSSKWREIFAHSAEAIEEHAPSFLGLDKTNIQETMRKLNLSLDDLDAWVALSKKAKELLEKGLLDFDVIKQETLFAVLIVENDYLDQFADLLNLKPKTNLKGDTQRE